jgi:hypothetical protein
MVGSSCAWCTAPIRLGIVTRGGVVWQLACWQVRCALVEQLAE